MKAALPWGAILPEAFSRPALEALISDCRQQVGFQHFLRFPFLEVRLAGCFSLLIQVFVFEAIGANLSDNVLDRFLELGFLQLAFPDNNHRPPIRLYPAPYLLVAFLIASDFGRPEFSVSLGDIVVFAPLVTVPKAAVNEDDCVVLWKNNVWLSWEAIVILTVTKSLLPESVTQLYLRLGGS